MEKREDRRDGGLEFHVHESTEAFVEGAARGECCKITEFCVTTFDAADRKRAVRETVFHPEQGAKRSP
jgi:hypothetical protein